MTRRAALATALALVLVAGPVLGLPNGGQHTVSATATVLDSSSSAYSYITIRLEAGASICYFGDSDVTAVPANAHGYVTATADAGESWTFTNPNGGGIAPSSIYIIGTPGDVLFWTAG